MNIIFALIVYLLTIWAPAPEVRYDTGVITSRSYVEDGDYMVTTIETSDGNLWDVLDYTAPIGDSIIIEFDTMGTPDNIYDDAITGVVTFSEIN